MTARTPIAKARVSGADKKNPQRFRGRKAPNAQKPIGAPPRSLTEGEREAWLELAGDMGWLRAHHRTVLHMASRIKARLNAGEEVGVSAMALLLSLLSKLGGTPVDDMKVSNAVEESETDPAESFFDRPH